MCNCTGRAWRCGQGAQRMQIHSRTYLSYQSEPADYDGNLPYSLLYGSFWKTDRTFFYADSFPRKTNCWKSTGYSGLQSACYQTTNGGGFGAKQTSVSEIYPAIVTWKTGRPSKMIFSRYESMICSSPRHEMEITVRAGADENGIIRCN